MVFFLLRWYGIINSGNNIDAIISSKFIEPEVVYFIKFNNQTLKIIITGNIITA